MTVQMCFRGFQSIAANLESEYDFLFLCVSFLSVHSYQTVNL
jgi:hypothetical protein